MVVVVVWVVGGVRGRGLEVRLLLRGLRLAGGGCCGGGLGARRGGGELFLLLNFFYVLLFWFELGLVYEYLGRVVEGGGERLGVFFCLPFFLLFFSRFEGERGHSFAFPPASLSLLRCLITNTSTSLVSFFITIAITGALLSDKAERLQEGGCLDMGKTGGH